MKRNKPKIVIENDTIFMSLDLKGLGLYDRGRVIRQFINCDIKVMEDYINAKIKAIFRNNGINISQDNNCVYKSAFDSLKAINKEIKVIDFYNKHDKFVNCEFVTQKDNITILLESDRYLICGVEISEEKL